MTMREEGLRRNLVGLFTLLLVAPVMADVSVIVSGGSAYRNQPVDVFVILENGFNEPAGINLDLLCPANVIPAPSCSLDPDLAAAGFTLTTTEIPTGKIRLLVYPPLQPEHPESLPPTFSDGTVAVCSATVKSDAPYGNHALGAELLKVSNNYGNTLAVTLTAGQLGVLGGGGGCSSTGVGSTAELPLVLLIGLVLGMVRRFGSKGRALGILFAILATVSLADTAQGQVTTTIGGPPRIAISGSWEQSNSGVDAKVNGTNGTPNAALEHLGLPQGRPTATPRWHAWDVGIQGNKIQGRVTFVGADFLRNGWFEATLSSRGHIRGVLYNGENEEVGTFRGKLTVTSLRAYVKATAGTRGRVTWNRVAEGK